jgi:tetratricopeptide (TPR) repeat protein
LIDIAFSYSFPGIASVYIGHFGDQPSAGTLRFTTRYETVVFRQRNADRQLGTVLATIDIPAITTKYLNALVNDYPGTSALERDIILGVAKYGLGLDEDAIGLLTPVLQDPSHKWDGRLRLLRADAYLNVVRYSEALHDYEWITEQRSKFESSDVVNALLGRAKIARVYGDDEAAVADYNAVLKAYAWTGERADVAYSPSHFIDFGVGAIDQVLIPAIALRLSELWVSAARFGSPATTATIARSMLQNPQKPVTHPKRVTSLKDLVQSGRTFYEEISHKYNVETAYGRDAPEPKDVAAIPGTAWAKMTLTSDYRLSELVSALQQVGSFFSLFSSDDNGFGGLTHTRFSTWSSFTAGPWQIKCSLLLAASPDIWNKSKTNSDFAQTFLVGLVRPGGDVSFKFNDAEVPMPLRQARDDFEDRLKVILGHIARAV